MYLSTVDIVEIKKIYLQTIYWKSPFFIFLTIILGWLAFASASRGVKITAVVFILSLNLIFVSWAYHSYYKLVKAFDGQQAEAFVKVKTIIHGAGKAASLRQEAFVYLKKNIADIVEENPDFHLGVSTSNVTSENLQKCVILSSNESIKLIVCSENKKYILL